MVAHGAGSSRGYRQIYRNVQLVESRAACMCVCSVSVCVLEVSMLYFYGNWSECVAPEIGPIYEVGDESNVL